MAATSPWAEPVALFVLVLVPVYPFYDYFSLSLMANSKFQDALASLSLHYPYLVLFPPPPSSNFAPISRASYRFRSRRLHLVHPRQRRRSRRTQGFLAKRSASYLARRRLPLSFGISARPPTPKAASPRCLLSLLQRHFGRRCQNVTSMTFSVLHIYPPTSTKFLSPINADCSKSFRIGAFFASWLLGTFLMVSIMPPLLQGPRSLEVSTSLLSYILLWVSSTYLK
ncbi:hypothetical protein GW17_00048565 [Ensete ventricosum]|nr:hypothetical protein GW17_00048565 [Ensete ventricosum]